MTVDLRADPIGWRIFSAFASAPSSSSAWRPVFGIAKASGLSEGEVDSYISKHPEYFEKASLIVSGSALYRPTTTIVSILAPATKVKK